ncbi:glycosyltransferase family 2 protein [Arundinibacter roseus]|uniref:Glycosyltransferase family 2 protein n=1 Tax=Arundinibacter roseus TaxID=2070510 RepID=A0A4R4K7V3_9BACT|nr:glycosyltransferase family 2 protein [Arundinibacter roseus]TDB63737.1 glycosyltransferase family 2 protein [Arundinibacter roseus]
MKQVAIVILNYNGQKHLEQFLPSVRQFSEGCELWVADNASTDSSMEWLAAQPGLNLLTIPENKGYAGGYNYALSRIEAEFYVLLNSDVEVTPHWIEPVISYMQANSNVAACQPKIKSFATPTHFEYAGAAGGFMDYLGYPYCRGRIFDTCEKDSGQYDHTMDVFWATGACLFVRAKDFHAVGGFDELFFAHMEEIDLCWRLINRGHRISCCGQSEVFHVGGGTLHKSNPRKTFLNYRNNLVMLYKNLPAKQLFPVLLARLLLDGVSSVRFIMAGAWPDVWAIVRAHFAFYGLIPKLSRMRKELPIQAELYQKSVVWQYFIKGKKRFSQLP